MISNQNLVLTLIVIVLILVYLMVISEDRTDPTFQDYTAVNSSIEVIEYTPKQVIYHKKERNEDPFDGWPE